MAGGSGLLGRVLFRPAQSGHGGVGLVKARKDAWQRE